MSVLLDFKEILLGNKFTTTRTFSYWYAETQRHKAFRLLYRNENVKN